MGISQIRGATSYTGDLLAGLVAMAAAVTTVRSCTPPRPGCAAHRIPQGWANIRAAKATYEHFLRMTSRTRRLAVTGGLITDRQDAAEVRAFTTQPVLLAEHRRIARSLEREALASTSTRPHPDPRPRYLRCRHRTRLHVLGLLIYTGSLPSHWPAPPRWPCALPPARLHHRVHRQPALRDQPLLRPVPGLSARHPPLPHDASHHTHS